MKSNLKKLSRAALVCFFLTLLPSIISAEMLRITVNYAKGVERSDQNRIDVKDGYWNFPVLDVPEVLEKGKYAIIIEGYNTTKPLIEDLAIVGMNFTKKDLLLPAGAILTIENRENFQRTLSISQEGDKENVFLTILPNSSLQRQFSNPGNYVVADANFPWNVSFIMPV